MYELRMFLTMMQAPIPSIMITAWTFSLTTLITTLNALQLWTALENGGLITKPTKFISGLWMTHTQMTTPTAERSRSIIHHLLSLLKWIFELRALCQRCLWFGIVRTNFLRRRFTDFWGLWIDYWRLHIWPLILPQASNWKHRYSRYTNLFFQTV